MNNRTKLIAIIGGSGAGKTWLADRLQRALGANAGRLSLDDFYLDRSSFPPAEREKINFDHPDTIDWRLFEEVLRQCRAGQSVQVPHYHFGSHTRRPFGENFIPRPLVLVEGLWLLWQPRIHELFDTKIFLDCPAQLRLARRLARDTVERGRSEDSIRSQFWKNVVPMHDRFVAPQAKWANLILQVPLGEAGYGELLKMLERDLSLVTSSERASAGGATPTRGFSTEEVPASKIRMALPDFADGSFLPPTHGARGADPRDTAIQSDLP